MGGGSISGCARGSVTSKFGGFIVIWIGRIWLGPSSAALSPAALKNLDKEPVSIEHFEKTIEYSRALHKSERQYEATEVPITRKRLPT